MPRQSILIIGRDDNGVVAQLLIKDFNVEWEALDTTHMDKMQNFSPDEIDEIVIYQPERAKGTVTQYGGYYPGRVQIGKSE